jgi:hypothetical protein
VKLPEREFVTAAFILWGSVVFIRQKVQKKPLSTAVNAAMPVAQNNPYATVAYSGSQDSHFLYLFITLNRFACHLVLVSSMPIVL